MEMRYYNTDYNGMRVIAKLYLDPYPQGLVCHMEEHNASLSSFFPFMLELELL